MVRAAAGAITRRSGAAGHASIVPSGCTTRATMRGGGRCRRPAIAATPVGDLQRRHRQAVAERRRWRTRCRPTSRPAARSRPARPAARCRSACRSRSAPARPPARRGPAGARSWSAPMLLENLKTSADRQHAVRVRVVDGVLAHHHPPHQAVEPVVGLDRARVQRRRDGEGLHRRAGLVRVGDGAVARAGLGRARRDRSGCRSARDAIASTSPVRGSIMIATARLGVVLRRRRRQRALGDERQVAVDREHDVAARRCSARPTVALDRDVAPERVPHPLDRRRRAAQLLVERQLDAVEAVALGRRRGPSPSPPASRFG